MCLVVKRVSTDYIIMCVSTFYKFKDFYFIILLKYFTSKKSDGIGSQILY